MDLFTEPIRELLPYDGSARLFSDLWTSAQLQDLLDTLMTELPWRQPTLHMYGRSVLQPRLTAWFGDPERVYTYSGVRLEPLPWTSTLMQIRMMCEKLAHHQFNSVLANLYRDGRDGVAWHSDNEPELGQQPVIASVSLGATRRFDMRHRKTGVTVKTSLESGTVLVMSGLSQQCWVHQVPKTAQHCEPRINLTFRSIHV